MLLIYLARVRLEGCGAGLLAFVGGQLKPGLELVMDALNMDDILASGLDLVITGEGSINGQSLFGKVPVGLARRAKNIWSAGGGYCRIHRAGCRGRLRGRYRCFAQLVLPGPSVWRSPCSGLVNCSPTLPIRLYVCLSWEGKV